MAYFFMSPSLHLSYLMNLGKAYFVYGTIFLLSNEIPIPIQEL